MKINECVNPKEQRGSNEIKKQVAVASKRTVGRPRQENLGITSPIHRR